MILNFAPLAVKNFNYSFYGSDIINFKKIGFYMLLICILVFTVNLVFADSNNTDISSIGEKEFNVLDNFTLKDNPTEQEWYDNNEWEGQLLREGYGDDEFGYTPYSPYTLGIQKKDVSKEEAEKYISKYLPSDYRVSSIKLNDKLTNIYYYETDEFGYYDKDNYGNPLGDNYYRGYIYADGNIYWYVGGSVVNPWLYYN